MSLSQYHRRAAVTTSHGTAAEPVRWTPNGIEDRRAQGFNPAGNPGIGMDVRDAVEADAHRLAELTGAPTDVMRNLVHDRTVRVAEKGDDVVGFVSFDAERDVVHVTQLEGTVDAEQRLLEEPCRFAHNEGMVVEMLVVGEDRDLREVAEDAGFEDRGTGPVFDGTPTIRYRLDADRTA